MPMYQFKCPDGHEFEKIVQVPGELHKWCKHCDRLTIWVVILDPHSQYYKERVCSDCLGSQHHAPLLSPTGPANAQGAQEVCPECGKLAEHVIRIEKRGSHSGGPTVADSSVRFHFNYLEGSNS